MSDALIAELNVPEAVKRELIVGFNLKMQLADLAQKRIGEVTRRLGAARCVEGLGAPIARIQADIYYRMRQKFGAECWKDQSFVDSYLKHNEGARVKTRPRKTTILRP